MDDEDKILILLSAIIDRIRLGELAFKVFTVDMENDFRPIMDGEMVVGYQDCETTITIHWENK